MKRLGIHLVGGLTKGTELILLGRQPLPVILKNAGNGVGILLHGFDFIHGKQRPAQGGNLPELGHQLRGVNPIFPTVPVLPLRSNQPLFLIEPRVLMLRPVSVQTSFLVMRITPS